MFSPYVLCHEILDVIPTILDPITYKNAGKSSYRISDLKLLFNNTYDQANQIKLLIEKKQINANENIVNVLLSRK